MAVRKWSPAYKIAGLYVLFGALWIIWSDWLLTLWIDDVEHMRVASTNKGWFFVGITGLMLFFLIRKSMRQIEHTRFSYSEALRESERQLSTLMANFPGMAFRCCNDSSWTMLFVSKGCESLTGYPAHAIENSTLLTYARIIHPEDRRRVYAEVQKKVQTKAPYELNYRIVTADGQVKHVWEQAMGIYDQHDNLKFIEGYVIDISAQKQAAQTIREQVQKLEQANAELDRFAQSVSHDLRSPLVTIEGFLSLIREDVQDGNMARIEKKLARIRGIIEKMHQLLEDLLKLSRLGQIADPKTNFPMYEAVAEVLDHIQGIIQRHECTLDADPGMPRVYADKSRIQMVWQNLIENAIKFRMPGRHPHLIIGGSEKSDEQVFYIRDNGLGIDPRHHHTIFELFSRLDTRVPGTGVGLSLVERIIRHHGGKVWVESEGQGMGSTFFFSLPKKSLSEAV